MSYPPHDPNNPHNGGSNYPQYPGGNAAGGAGYPQYPGGGGGYMPAGGPPPNNLVFAIISAVLCCMPLGVIAIIFATQVNSKWAQGDVAGAEKASRNAKNFAIWSVISVVILYGALAVLGFAGVFTWSDYI